MVVTRDNQTPHGHNVTYPCLSPVVCSGTSALGAFPKVTPSGSQPWNTVNLVAACQLKSHGHISGTQAGQLKSHGQAGVL